MSEKRGGLVIGFTGSRRGPTEDQVESLRKVLDELGNVTAAHHGDAEGADAAFHKVCLERQIPVEIHPPRDEKDRAYCEGAVRVHEARDFRAQGQAIVNACKLLIAMPDGYKEKLRSGTWTTIRYARKIARKILIIWPDGTLKREN